MITRSLEVIPGDAYKVEKSGDDVSGYVTRVIYKEDGKSTKPVVARSLVDDDGDDGDRNTHRKKKGGMDDEARSEDDGITTTTTTSSETTTTTKKERRRLRREANKILAKEERAEREKERQRTDSSSSSSTSAPSSASTSASDGDIDALRTTWSIAAPGVCLHSALCRGLHAMGYGGPTPIQASTLPPAILGRRDIVGAAPTGSGKTLSYGLPILQRLLEERDDGGTGEGGDDMADEIHDEDGGEEDGEAEAEGGSRDRPRRRVLRALILTPTRELAMQVASELTRVCHGGDVSSSSSSRTRTIGIGTIVGGFAEAKQRRILEKDRPAVLVATPGRLWEMVSRSEEKRNHGTRQKNHIDDDRRSHLDSFD